jgi:hypothetical protein
MKNLTITFIFLYSAFTACSQDPIEFSNIFKPVSEYVITSISEIEMSVTIEGSDEFIAHLKSKGINNPQITQQNSEMIIGYITGKEADGVMTIELKYLETGMPQDGYIRNGESLKGTYSRKDKIKIKELPDPDRIGSESDVMMTMMSEGLSIDLFENEKLAIGDSVKITSPMNIPIGPYNAELEIINTYFLESLESEIASFSIKLDCILKSNYPDVNLSASGGGSGSCTFNITQQRIIEKSYDLDLDMSVDLQNNASMIIHQKMKSSDSTTIK